MNTIDCAGTCGMKRPYIKPCIIPRTERHLWPREARIMEATEWWDPTPVAHEYLGVKNLRAIVDAALGAEAELLGASLGGYSVLPTADEQDRRIRRDEIAAMWGKKERRR